MWIKSFENSALKIVKKDLHLLNSSSAEIRDKHKERKEKKGFLKFEANGNLSHVSALIWLEFHTFTHDWVSRKNEITQMQQSKKSQLMGKKSQRQTPNYSLKPRA